MASAFSRPEPFVEVEVLPIVGLVRVTLRVTSSLARSSTGQSLFFSFIQACDKAIQFQFVLLSFALLLARGIHSDYCTGRTDS